MGNATAFRLGRTRKVILAAAVLVASGCAATPQLSPPSSGAAPIGASRVPGSVLPSAAVAAAQSASPSVPPQPAGRLAFSRFEGAFGTEAPYIGAFITRSDGTDERPLKMPIDVAVALPVWSSDGRRLLLDTLAPSSDDVRAAVVNADGTGFGIIAPAIDDLFCWDWSPDGGLLACSISSDTPDLDGIYTIHADGTDLLRLTTSPFHHTVGSAGECGGGDDRAVFSPDGSQIAFVRQRCGTGVNPSSDESAAIEVMNHDGTGLREIVPQGGVKTHGGSLISWSPDGTTIALGSQAGELFLVNPDGTGLAQIPLPKDLGSHHAYGPEWSPDGTRLVFSMFVESKGSTDLYTIAPDGSNLVQITNSDGAENFASWGPAAP
jgi:WD40 repeat protein